MTEKKTPLEIDMTVRREPNAHYVHIEGVLLPRNPDGSLQFDEHTSIAPEAAEGLLQRFQEAKTASHKVIHLCNQQAPIEQIVRADATADDAWLRYEGDKRRAAEQAAEGVLQRLKESAEVTLQRLKETEVDAIMADMEKLQERAVTEGYAAHDHPSFFIAPEAKSEMDMLQEGCPHHDPVD